MEMLETDAILVAYIPDLWEELVRFRWTIVDRCK